MPTLGEVLAKALTPPPPPPKQLLLSNTYTLHESQKKLWTPTETDFSSPPVDFKELYAQGRDLETSLYTQGRDFELSLSSPRIVDAFPKPLTVTEQGKMFAGAIRNIPKAISEIGAQSRTLGATIGRGLDWLERRFPQGPLDPYGRPVPRWNVQLYLLARRAYQGDVEAQARFLDEIKAEGTDALTYIQTLLRPTFEPSPQDLAGRRRAWEQSPPEDARHWLRKRLGNLRSQQEAPRNGKVDVGDIEHLLEAPAHPEANPELWAFYQSEIEMWRNRAREILTPKRYEVFLLLEEGYSPEEIAHTRRRDSGTIRKQVWEIRNNPQLRARGDQLREQLWWGQPRWE